MHRRGALHLLAAAVLLSAASCAARRHAGPASGAPPSAIGVRYRGSIESGGKSVRVRTDLYAAAPDLVRAEIASPLGQPLASFILRGDDLTILWLRERAWWRGSARDQSVAGLPGGGEVWAALLLGDAARLAALGEATPAAGGAGSSFRFTAPGASEILVRYGGAAITPAPDAIDAKPAAGLAIQLERSGRLDPPDPAKAFDPTPPPGFERWIDFDLPSMIDATAGGVAGPGGSG